MFYVENLGIEGNHYESQGEALRVQTGGAWKL